MSLNIFTNYIINNDDLDTINLNNLGFPISFNINNYSSFNLNSLILDSNETSNKKSDISIGHLANREINILNSNWSDINNNTEYFKNEERSEKSINLKNEESDSKIFTKGIYYNYSKQMIYEAMNETKKKRNKIKNKRSNLFTQYPKNHRKKKKNILSRRQNSDNIRKKIKSRFLKCLKNEINKKLKKAGSKYFFKHLPYSFVCNLSKKINKNAFNLTLK